jgi:hypothetical protein
VSGKEAYRRLLVVALAVAFSLMGGAKFATWDITLGRVDLWTSTVAWKAVLSIAGAVELLIGIALVLVRAPQRLLRWTLRLLAAYAVVLIVGEVTMGGFSRSCGCLGPGVALGLAQHLTLTGVLVALTWWCEYLHGKEGDPAEEPTTGAVPS